MGKGLGLTKNKRLRVSGYMLDVFPGAVAGYSLRNLTSAWEGQDTAKVVDKMNEYYLIF